MTGREWAGGLVLVFVATLALMLVYEVAKGIAP